MPSKTSRRFFYPGIILAGLGSALANRFRYGDVVSTSYSSQQLGSRGGAEGGTSGKHHWRTPWDEALRSDMPRYGRSGLTSFTLGLPNEYTPQGNLAASLAFDHERFVLPWFTVRDPVDRKYLDLLVVTFVHAGADILKARFESHYNVSERDLSSSAASFTIEYRWDREPEQDGQAAISFVCAAAMIVTIVLLVNVCNSSDGDDVRHWGTVDDSSAARDRNTPKEVTSVGPLRRRR